MPKWVNTSVLDAAINQIRSASSISVTNTQPTTGTEASTTYKLAFTVASLAAVAAGDAGGNSRKLVVNAHSNVTVDATGSAGHVALYTGSTLYYVTTCTTQLISSGNTVTIPTWKIEFADPT